MLPTEQFQKLLELSASFNSALDLDEVLTNVLHETREALEAERRVMIRVPFTLEEPSWMVTSGNIDKVSDTIVDKVMRSRASILLHNVESEMDEVSESLAVERVKSILCAPIIHMGRTLGLLYLDDTHRHSVFDPGDQAFLEAIANQAAPALGKARFYFRLTRFRQLALELSRETKVSSLARKLVADLLELTDAERVALVHMDQEESLKVLYGRDSGGRRIRELGTHSGIPSSVLRGVVTTEMPRVEHKAMGSQLTKEQADVVHRANERGFRIMWKYRCRWVGPE